MIPFRSVIDMVREFCMQRRTGTVFIVSDDNRMAQVHLESGNIVALLCRGRRGQEAVAGIRSMQAARLRFDDNYLTATDAERFDTGALLDLLGGSAQADTRGSERVVQLRGAKGAVDAAAAPAPSHAAVTPAQVAACERLLIQYIGPMGEIICADHAGQAANVKALIALLAEEIPDKAQATQFAREAARSLGL
jgi:hypothetical protein